MADYKLTYFNLRANAEINRLLLSVAGLKWEDHRIGFDEWPKLKPITPGQQLPILKLSNGKTITNSAPITRFIAAEFKLAGANHEDFYLCDRVLDVCMDVFKAFTRFMLPTLSDEAKAKGLELFKNGAPANLKRLSDFLKENTLNSGYFVGNSITFADLACAKIVEDFALLPSVKHFLDAVPDLVEHQKKVYQHPRIQVYLKTRPETQF